MGLTEKLLWVSLGGALGALFRVLIADWTVERWGGGFPYGTLLVNIGGSFLLGFLVALSLHRATLSPELLAFFGAGFCGAFTTVSTFTVETIQLSQTSGVGLSIFNIFLNNSLALLGAFIGMLTARTMS
jgi:CrcB protein